MDGHMHIYIYDLFLPSIGEIIVHHFPVEIKKRIRNIFVRSRSMTFPFNSQTKYEINYSCIRPLVQIILLTQFNNSVIKICTYHSNLSLLIEDKAMQSSAYTWKSYVRSKYESTNSVRGIYTTKLYIYIYTKRRNILSFIKHVILYIKSV